MKDPSGISVAWDEVQVQMRLLFHFRERMRMKMNMSGCDMNALLL